MGTCSPLRQLPHHSSQKVSVIIYHTGTVILLALFMLLLRLLKPSSLHPSIYPLSGAAKWKWVVIFKGCQLYSFYFTFVIEIKRIELATFKNYYITFISIGVCTCHGATACAHRGQRATCRSWVPSTVWVLGIKLRLSCLATSACLPTEPSCLPDLTTLKTILSLCL